MKNLPIGIQTFRKIMEGNYLYIDKTREVFKLISGGGQFNFISRPRRFGKSLFISTLKELFLGNKELFKDLWIYDKIDWAAQPVIHLDFSSLDHENAQVLKNSLVETVDAIGAGYGVQLTASSYKNRFGELIRKLSKNGKVAVLIDEYDKPIIDHLDNLKIAKENRKILRTFYETLKGADQYLNFVFITGVSKFSRVSVFSGLNNLRDITLSGEFSTILGWTEDDLMHYFSDAIKDLAKKKNVTKDFLAQNIKKWYNGYSWNGVDFVYNPHSILNFFKEGQFDNYWFTSATPTFLIEQIRNHQTPVENFDNYETDNSIFESYDLERMNVVSLLFQTGYLTIKRIEEISLTSRAYYLSYPNTEVKESFLKHLLAEFSGKYSDEIGMLAKDLHKRLKAADIDGFFGILKSLIASIPYNIFVENREGYYSTIIYLALTLAGIDTGAEVQTNQGRLDTVIETEAHIYIMEFKIGKASEAIRQIKNKKYYERYLTSGKDIKIIGIGLDVKQRNIGDYITETVEKTK